MQAMYIVCKASMGDTAMDNVCVTGMHKKPYN